VGLSPDDSIWHPTTFTKNRERLLNEQIMERFLEKLMAAPEVKPLRSDEHFSVDGTLLQAFASHAPPALPSDRGHVPMDNRHGLIVDCTVMQAVGTGERDAAKAMAAPLATRATAIDQRPPWHRECVGAPLDCVYGWIKQWGGLRQFKLLNAELESASMAGCPEVWSRGTNQSATTRQKSGAQSGGDVEKEPEQSANSSQEGKVRPLRGFFRKLLTMEPTSFARQLTNWQEPCRHRALPC